MTDPAVLIVSPHFPPSAVAGVHRARHMAKHLPRRGWRPIVVSAAPRHYAERGDPALAELVPQDLTRIGAGALPAGLCRIAGVGDIGLRAYPFLARALDDAMAAHEPKAVFITGSPFYPLLLGARLRRQYRVPVVLDFQDPWVSAYGATRPRWSKAGMAHGLARILEPRAVKAASWITSVSQTQNAEMAARYPWLDPERMAAIPIGGDPDDFEAVKAAAATPTDARRITFSYVGTVLPRAESLIRTLFGALADLRASQPRLADRIRLNFVGTSNRTDGAGQYALAKAAEAEGLADLVEETPERVPYLDALRVMATSHALLLIGSDEPHYTPSKIYPALMSGRPYLSLLHARCSAHAILAAAGGGRSLAFETAEELAALRGPLAEALADLAERPERFGRADPAAYADYTAHAVAGRFAEIFERLQAEGCRA